MDAKELVPKVAQAIRKAQGSNLPVRWFYPEDEGYPYGRRRLSCSCEEVEGMKKRKFSKLKPDEKLSLGSDFGLVVQGGCEHPEDKIEAYLERRGIVDDVDPLEDIQFTEGLDRMAECCECCGWYVEPCQLNDYRYCEDCASDEDEEDWVD